ncbi:MAG: phosphatidate cytidylyltransferase [Anaerolineales bacterium]
MVLLLLPIGLAVIFWGQVPFAALVALIVFLATREYVALFQHGGLPPAEPVLLGGAVALSLVHGFSVSDSPVLLGVIFFTALVHLWDYEHGASQSATQFAITLAGSVYFGYLSAYLIRLRNLTGGAWWLLLVLISIWVADSAAYAAGKNFGRHLLSPRTSPKKTWEGYVGGVLGGALGGYGFAILFGHWHAAILPWHGILLGVVLAAITPLGDLTESLFKRQFGVKDSSNLLPGHGGMWDRIDSWLWAAPLGYYIITQWFL